jgi:hemoglobin/transferrin/lactoferrin receptor protein
MLTVLVNFTKELKSELTCFVKSSKCRARNSQAIRFKIRIRDLPMRAQKLRLSLLGTASCLGLLVGLGPVMAQEDVDEFIGVIDLTGGKREINTDTAIPETTIDQEEINDRQAGTLAELIDTVPGVTLVNGSTPQGSGINIRGFGANGTYGTDQKVLIIIDGATTGSEEIYRIGNQLFTDPELYKSLSVIRGTVGSFEYGSGVVGGVVIAESKNASDFTGGEVGFKFRQTFGGSSNGGGFVSSSILAWQPTENAEFLLNYTYRDQNNQKDGAGSIINNSAFNMPSYLAKGRFTFGELGEHAVTFSYSDSTSEERDVPYDSFGNVNFGNVDRDIRSKVAGLKYEYNPLGNDLVNIEANLTYADQQIDSTPVIVPSFSLLDADHRYETTKLTVKNSAFFNTGTVSHDLRAGVEYIQRERLDASSAPGGTDKRFAIFAVDEMEIADHWTVTPALRYETQDITGSVITDSYDNDALMGGISTRYEFDSGFAVFGSAAYTEALPIIDDLGTPAYMTQSEKARTYEVGFSYFGTDLISGGDVARFKANVYDTTLWDMTSYVSGSPSMPLQDVRVKGIELEASYGHSSGVYVDVNANIVDGDETSSTGAVTRWRNTPADTVRLTVGKRFGDMLDVSWEQLVSKSVTDSSGAYTSGFGISNLRATYIPQQGVFEGTEIRVGVENLFDRDYRPYLSTRNAVGRNLKLTIAKTF